MHSIWKVEFVLFSANPIPLVPDWGFWGEKGSVLWKGTEETELSVKTIVECSFVFYFPLFPGTVHIPRISQYLYFLFAPTLIYRDNYPR